MKLSISAALLVLLPTLAAAAPPVVGGCQVFPADNVWNTRIDHLPVEPKSDAYIASIGDTRLVRDFGAGLYEGQQIGVPVSVVPQDQGLAAIRYVGFGDTPDAYPDESDHGSFPIPSDAQIEGGPDSDGDRHVVVVRQGSCALFELYRAVVNPDGSWNAVAAARFDLTVNDLRHDGWTSADAAGLPIFPGLVRYDEVAAGEIAHALRFTAPKTRNAYVWPARHAASDSDDPDLPPMGQRFRLKASVDISGYSKVTQVILQALKTYGLILADNGSPWFMTGIPDDRWDNDTLHAELGEITGSDFEAVDTTSLMIDPNSAQARQP